MPRPFSAHLGRKRGIAMDRFARAFVFVLLLAAAGVSAGCSGSTSEGTFDRDTFWKEQQRDQPTGFRS